LDSINFTDWASLKGASKRRDLAAGPDAIAASPLRRGFFYVGAGQMISANDAA
jgi:hypothetical protein